MMKINTGLIDRGRPVLVAISGGADSVAMLHMLVSAGYDCVAAHCNFHLRGADSDSDEAFVRSFCDRMGVPLRVAQFDTLAYASQKKVSIEMAARELRYDWFFSILDETGIPVVAVAHHADDSAETFFLNLVRGTGLRGLAGMKSIQGRVVRPMLGISRAEVELYCKAKGLSFVTDCTNNTDDYARNRIRHHVIPEFKRLNPSFLSTMESNMRHMSQILTIFEAQVASFRESSVSHAGDCISIAASGLEALAEPEPFIFEVLAPLGFSPKSVHDVARCFAERRFGRVFFSDGWRAVVDRSGIIVHPLSTTGEAAQAVVDGCPASVSSPLSVEVSRWPKPADYAFSRDPFVMHFDADKVAFPIALRHWRIGDTFRPLGMKGAKKLSDFFIDQKLSLPQKEAAWVAEAGGKILCILGMRIDDRFKVTPATENILEIRYSITK